MRRLIALVLWCGLVFVPGMSMAQPAYPTTPVVDVAEQHFGETVRDPFRWLENDVRVDPQVRAWVDAQNQTTEDYLGTLPGRAAIRRRMTELTDYARYGVPVTRGTRYFFLGNIGLQQQSVLYFQDGIAGSQTVLIDPNSWARDGATALAEWEPDQKGQKLAYAIQDGGSDWRTVKVIDVVTGKLLADSVGWVKFSRLDWAADGSGFYYSRFPAPPAGAEFQSLNLDHAIYFHRIGTPQSADRLIYATPDRPKLLHRAEVTADGRWLVVTSVEGTADRHEVTLIDIAAPKAQPRTLITGMTDNWQLIGAIADRLYFITNLDAPRQRLVAIDVSRPDLVIEPIVAERAATLVDGALVGNRLVLEYLVDAKSEAIVYDLDGKPVMMVPLPGIGSTSGFAGNSKTPETFFSFSSFNVPARIFRFDVSSGRMTPFREPELRFNPDDYVVTQRFYASKDGTKVPMFLAHRKDLDLSAGAPTLLYGYGGFNISLTPGFSASRLAWMEMGGVFALANLRGGGEYGRQWHDAGRLAQKQNVFDDFIAAAENLIASGVTTRDKLAIQGGSNGGLLVGAVVNQRPDLFAAALPAVGVMDMLRFDRFTAGRYWVDDYGYPEREADWRVLRAYSPYHNVRDGADYPAILATTADTDDRVVPGHTFKYTAALQAADIGAKPHLVRVETRAGHGSGKPTDKLIEETADQWAFIAKWTGMKLAEPMSADRTASPIKASAAAE